MRDDVLVLLLFNNTRNTQRKNIKKKYTRKGRFGPLREKGCAQIMS
jgi:hypothetical protein